MKKLLTFLTLLTLFFATGWAAEQTITLTATTFGSPTSYQEKTATVSGYTFTVNKMITSTASASKGAIQMNNTQGNGTLYNTTAIPGLKSVKVNVASGNKTYTITTGTNQNPTTNSQTGTTGGTYNAASGDTYFQLKVSGASYFSSIEITYDPDASSVETYDVTCNSATNGSISVGSTTSYAEGATVTVTANPDNGYKLSSVTVTPSTSGVAAPEVTISGNTATFTMPASDVTVSASFTETVTTQYKLVENANDLDAGAEYILVGSTNSAPYSGILGSISSNIGTVETTGFNYDSSEKTITIEDGSNVTPLKLGGSKDAWTFHNGTGYLSYTGSSNTLSTANDASSKTAQWIIYDDVMPSSNILIANANSTSRYINYNSSTTPKRFACYTGTGLQSAVALFKKVETGDYTITVDDAIEHGTVTASRSSANENDQVVVNITPDAGYELASLTVDGTNVTSIVSDNSYSFNMPAHNVTITATFSKVNYTITKAPMTNGNVTVPATANYGDVVTITPEPATDYVVDKVYYNDGSDHEVAINNNAYTFTMPASNVTVWATFVEYFPTLRLAGRFNGRNTSSWITDSSGPEFTYDTSTEKYTIDAYFIGASQDEGSDVDFFYLRSDDDDLKANASGNCWVSAEGGTYNLGGSSNFRIYPGVYNITVNKARTSITFTKITPVLTFSPNGGEVEAGQTVTVTSNLQTLVDNIKNTYDSGATGTVNHSVSTDQNNWDDNVTLNTIGSATVYGRAVLGNIYATGNAAYTVVAANTNTQYQLITSTDDLIAGKKYIIVSTGSYTTSGTTYNFTKAAGAPNAANNLILDADVTISDEIVDLDGISGVTEFTLGGSTGKWTFAFGDGTYLASSAAKSAKADVTATPASISFSGNEATINMGSVGYFQYNPNNGNGRFAAYTSTQKPVMLFKQVEGTVTQKSAAPEITPESGNVVGFSQEVEITQANGGIIYYTTDGTTPTEDPTHQYNGKFWAEGENLGDEVTITAVAKEEGKELSNPVSVTYKFIAPAAPTFSPQGGTYTSYQYVELASATEGADVYYTTDGSTPSVTNGTKYTEPIPVTANVTIKAITIYHDAHADKDAVTSPRQAKYTIVTDGIVEVENIAEFNAIQPDEDGEYPEVRFKNPVTVLYDYSQYSKSSELDAWTYQEYIWVKDQSGFTQIFLRPSLNSNNTTTKQIAFYENGDVIPGGFVVRKQYYETGEYYQAYSDKAGNDPTQPGSNVAAGFASATQKALAEPEPMTTAQLAALTTSDENIATYNNRYIRISKIKVTEIDGKNFKFEDEQGNGRNIAGYNKYSDATSYIKGGETLVTETINFPQAASDNDYYDVTAILCTWRNGWEIMPIEFTEWVDKTVTLRELCKEGDVGTVYTISNNLQVAYVNVAKNSIWVKDDDGQAIVKYAPNDEYPDNFAIEADGNTRLDQSLYDQSNWCEIQLAEGTIAADFEGKIIKGGSIKGTFTNKTNPTMTGVRLASSGENNAIYSDGSYEPNYYIPCNFYGNQSCQTGQHGQAGHGDFFFMTPKPQEFAMVVWSIWDSENEQMIITDDPNKNSHELKGSFSINLEMNNGITELGDLHDGTNDGFAYNFSAIIRKAVSGSKAGNSDNYMVYPVDLNAPTDPATAINSVNVNGKAVKSVKSVKYVNVAGIVSDRPFQGVNIVVTEYTDGTRTTSKMLRK